MTVGDDINSEVALRKLFRGDPGYPTAEGGILSLCSKKYREFSEEWKVAAETSVTEPARALALKMASIWLEAAMHIEAPLGIRRSEPVIESDPVGER